MNTKIKTNNKDNNKELIINKIRFFSTFGIIILAILLVTGCTNSNKINKISENQELSSQKILIVTTLFPLYEFSKSVGGENVEVVLILPPGTEPHTFEPKPSDITLINNADIFIYSGSVMEPWAHDIIEGIKNNKTIIIDASSKVDLLTHTEEEHDEDHKEETNINKDSTTEELYNHGDYDPHYWLNFDNNIKIVDSITEELSIKNPENKDYYYRNAQEYKEKLKKLDFEYTKNLEFCRQKEFITGGHNAYAYLANKYNITYVSAYGLSPNSEPTPKTIKEISDIAKEHNIKYILIEELLSPRMAEAIAEQTNLDILTLNPGHNILPEEFRQNVTFISLMENNLHTLKIALDCE